MELKVLITIDLKKGLHHNHKKQKEIIYNVSLF